VTLKSVRGQLKWYHSIDYVWFPIRTTILLFEIFDFRYAVTLKTGLKIREGHQKCHHSTESLWLPIDVL